MVALATAFVRIRPDLSGFKSETDRGVAAARLDQAGERAGRQFGGGFTKSLRSQWSGVFGGMRSEADRTAGDAGSSAGRSFGSAFTRDATTGLRGALGQFGTEGSAAGSRFGEAFVRDAGGRLSDGRGVFASQGRDGGDAIGRGFTSGAQVGITGIQGLISAGVALGPAIIPAAAAAAAALSGIGLAAASAFAGIGVGILAFQGVGEAVSAMGAAQDQAAQSAASLSGAQNAVASASDGVRSAQAALANSTANIAQAARQAARQVTDAQLSLTRAERDARDVRLELNDAQREARQRMDDLNQSVKENALAQRQSNLDIAEAKKKLDEVLANPKATEAQREQAKITYEQEVLQMEDLQERGKRLTEDQTKNAKTGVAGSAEVLAARERIAAADERVAQAQRSLADARSAQHQQERQGAFQLAQAQQAVISAQRALQQATVQSGLAGGAAMAKLKQAMDDLSPAGQRFATFLFGLKDEFRTLRDAAAEGALPGFQKAIQNVLPYLPRVEEFVGRIATKLGDLAIQASEAFKDPTFQEFFKILDKTAGPALQGMFDAALNVGKGFAGILNAFSPLNKDMGNGLVGLTQKFADFGAGLKDNKGFQEFLAYIRTNGPVVVKFFGDMVTFAKNLVIALAPVGAVILGALGAAASFLASLSPGTIQAIIAAIAALGATFGVTSAIIAIQGAGGLLAYLNGIKLVQVATKIWTGVQWLLNAAMAANPIGIVIIAIVALVAALVVVYQHSETFRNIVQAAWQGIQVAISWTWNNVIKPVFAAIAAFTRDVLVPIFLWLYNNVIKPVWTGIQVAISVAWAVIQVVFGLIQIYIKAVLAPVFLWLYNNVIKPVWTGIQIAISVAWAIIKVIFGLIQIYIKAVLAPIFTWLYNNVIKPVWNGIKATISAVWENGIKPIFNALAGIMKDHVAPAFKRGVDAVTRAWEGVRDAAKGPVKFIVETVLNNGLLAGYNRIAKVFGVKPDDVKIPLPKGFARGGILPGYTPGRDVHSFASPTGGRLDLSGGEAIIRPEGTRALGRGWVNGINSAARSGGVTAVQRFLGSYASGGILGDLGGAFSAARKTAGGFLGGIKDFVSDPAGTLRKIATKLIGLVPGKDTTFGKAITSVPGKVAQFAIDKVKNLFGGGSGGPTGAGPGFPPWPSGPGAQRGDTGVWRSILGLVRGAGIDYSFGNSYRHGDPLWHGSGRAVDFMGYNQDKLASFFMNMRPRVLELIHTTGKGGYYITRGQRQASMGIQDELHRNHLHVAMNRGGIMPPVRTYDQGGAWPSGTLGVNTSGRTEHVATGGTMDALVDLLEDLIVAVRQVAPGVGRELNGGLTAARQLSRARR